MCSCSIKLDSILKDRRSRPDQLIEVLQDIQQCYGYLPEDALRIVAGELGTPLIEVYRVACFYKAFSLKPRGKNVMTVCMGTACHVRGAKLLASQMQGQLGISAGETTGDGMFTLEQVNCLGACALGPVVVHNDAYHHHVTPAGLRRMIDTAAKSEKEGATNDKARKQRRTQRVAQAASIAK